MGEAVTFADILKYLWVAVIPVAGWLFKNTYAAMSEKMNFQKEGLEKAYDQIDRIKTKVIILENTSVSVDDLERKINEKFNKLEQKMDDITKILLNQNER